ncbi:hypothetical protein BD770DRAFT_240869 [Pilaira anomala]|nr:hypothetical protein BD770DRAFT_240869 [Pilaira anomala]
MYDKTMICGSSYKPDLLIMLNLPNKKQVDFFTCEVKKPFGNLSNQLESDYVKIHKEMKLLIDTQIDLGVQHPIAYSLLVEGYDLTLFKMELEYDGEEYRSKIAGKCRTVRDREDSLLLYHGISLMVYLENELAKLKHEIYPLYLRLQKISGFCGLKSCHSLISDLVKLNIAKIFRKLRPYIGTALNRTALNRAGTVFNEVRDQNNRKSPALKYKRPLFGKPIKVDLKSITTAIVKQ